MANATVFSRTRRHGKHSPSRTYSPSDSTKTLIGLNKTPNKTYGKFSVRGHIKSGTKIGIWVWAVEKLGNLVVVPSDSPVDSALLLARILSVSTEAVAHNGRAVRRNGQSLARIEVR
jgi:hypothetical protein